MIRCGQHVQRRKRTALRVVDGDWDQVKGEYGDEMIRLLMEAHGYTESEAAQSLASKGGSGEEESMIVVVEHGECTQLSQPQPQPASVVARRGAVGGGARVRKRRETTSRYGAGAFAVMEASLRGRGTDDGVT